MSEFTASRWSPEGDALTDIQRFSQSLFGVQVDHYDLVGDACNSQRISDGRAYAAGADDGNLAHWFAFLIYVYCYTVIV